jgi:hypothetical protein
MELDPLVGNGLHGYKRSIGDGSFQNRTTGIVGNAPQRIQSPGSAGDRYGVARFEKAGLVSAKVLYEGRHLRFGV